MEVQSDFVYFQYTKKLNLPIFLRFRLEEFGPDIINLLKEMQFERLDSEELAKVGQREQDYGFRMLTLKEPSHSVAKEIDKDFFDSFGPEKITPGSGYKVYRYSRVAMCVYSFIAQEWEVGCFFDFGHEEQKLEAMIVLNRILSWALAPHGIVGVWGLSSDKGTYVLDIKSSKGQAVFFDMENLRAISSRGVDRVHARYFLMRLDPVLKDRLIGMRPEELISFLMARCTFLDYEGPSAPIRQSVRRMATTLKGQVIPIESFRQRESLSL